MKATVLDLRYRMKDVFRAIDRGESITVTYRGTVKARIVPAGEIVTAKSNADPAFGMWRDRKDLENPSEYVRKIRQPRIHDI
jgi:antitoxin (DNA-binding transcriptional repressor) of toxin-antitoxin stability system